MARTILTRGKVAAVENKDQVVRERSGKWDPKLTQLEIY